MRRAGSSHNVASEHKWPTWAQPPVRCAGCGGRVTLKQSFRQDYDRGTFHAGCVPWRVTINVVEAR